MLRSIQLRGVEVHNLQRIDLDLPHGQLIVLCGVSGSGKSSLAFDTLYAEGQRRYIESFSAYTRQFLERLEKPAAERIDHIPAAVAISGRSTNRSPRSTVATATETHDYLRLLYARLGQLVCQKCGRPIVRATPESVLARIAALPASTRYLLAFPRRVDGPLATIAAQLREAGFARWIVGQRLSELADADAVRAADSAQADIASAATIDVVVDRLTAGVTSPERVRDSLSTVWAQAAGACVVVVPDDVAWDEPGTAVTIDGAVWRRVVFHRQLRCELCGIDFLPPEPRLFSFNSPLGACPTCEGFGNVTEIDAALVVPDASKSLRGGAIAPWNTPAYAHEREELLALAPDYQIDVDCPYAELDARARQLVQDGVAERKFGGLRGFFAWLERRKYKTHIRAFLSRWRSFRECPDCAGKRLRPEALAVRIGGRNLAEFSALQVRQALDFLDAQADVAELQRVSPAIVVPIRARLEFLAAVGLGYLTLDRTLRTLSGGEAQRVALTSVLGSNLVNMLYVLDEPSAGLHPQDTQRLIVAIRNLQERRNTVVVVEHEEALIRAADQVVEIGPGAGDRGGRVVFQGSPDELLQAPNSLTGDYLAGRRTIRVPTRRRVPSHGWLRLAGARGHNLQNVTVEFPLGLLCVVTGVSGSGKSTLVQDTLYPALARRLRNETLPAEPYDQLLGDGQLNDVLLVDQEPIGRSPRSNPVTYLKAFDEIRAVFADTVDAKTRSYTASMFSFNVEGGRCPQCDGDGALRVDMQFLADMYMPCSLCRGTRYRREVLDITYRGRNIAEVLDMTVREAFTFFRGHTKVQARLKRLIDVGLDYVHLGQAANTLSGGESQRLKLAAFLSAAKRGHTLFLLDEPTTGLHFADIATLLDCFQALLAVGHSLIVVEHNLQVIKSADYVIDLGPGAAHEGGRVVAVGSPEQVSRRAESITGQYLARALAEVELATAATTDEADNA